MIQVPSLLVDARCLFRVVEWCILFAHIQATEDEDGGNAAVFEPLDVVLDGILHGEGPASESWQKRLLKVGSVKHAVDVECCFNSDPGVLQLVQRMRLGQVDAPFFEVPDHGGVRCAVPLVAAVVRYSRRDGKAVVLQRTAELYNA